MLLEVAFGLLLSLAATSIIGTLIPQNSDPAAYVSVFGETLFRFFGVLGLFDMYHSWWFLLLLVPGMFYRPTFAPFTYDALDHRAYVICVGLLLLVLLAVRAARFVSVRG